MRLHHSFVVPVEIDQAWDVLTDLPRVAPCLPGATLESVEGNAYSGTVKIKVGPIALQYGGMMTLIEQDAAGRRVVLQGRGRDSRGQGSAEALIAMTLHPSQQHTRVNVETDLALSGKVAQFGRGAITDISERVLAEFVTRLRALVLDDGAADSADHVEALEVRPFGIRVPPATVIALVVSTAVLLHAVYRWATRHRGAL